MSMEGRLVYLNNANRSMHIMPKKAVAIGIIASN